MRKIAAVVFVSLFIPVSGQSLLPHKDLAFAQVAVGPTIDTLITLSNQGKGEYHGIMLLRRGKGEKWNPIVNGEIVSDGALGVRIGPGNTKTFHITGPEQEIGTALLFAVFLDLDSSVEGNLTFFFRSGDGAIADSIGVPPSQEFLNSSIGFEDFGLVALALSNFDIFKERNVELTLNLFSEEGELVATRELELGVREHLARFLPEIFEGVKLGRGRVDIRTEVPVVGTAITMAGSQFSTLPIPASPISYKFQTTAANGLESRGDLVMWVDGYFVRGYLVVRWANGEDLFNPVFNLINGRLDEGKLKLSFFAAGDIFPGKEAVFSIQVDKFDFVKTELKGSWILTYLDDRSHLEGAIRLSGTERGRTIAPSLERSF